MARVFWDSNLFIYLFERHPEFSPSVVALRKSMRVRGDVLLTSTFTVGEVLVKPLEKGDQPIYDRYRSFFRSSAITLVPFTEEAAVRYAAIRRDRSISKPDAIQLACAASAGVDLLITNDERLSTKHVPGIHFTASLARAPL